MKNLADGYRQTLKPILDLMRERAKMGYYFINISETLYDFEEKTQTDILGRLQKLGYYVKDDGMKIIIRWGDIQKEIEKDNRIQQEEMQRQLNIQQKIEEQEELIKQKEQMIKEQSIKITNLEGTITSQVSSVRKNMELQQEIHKHQKTIKTLESKIKTLETPKNT